MTAPPAGGPGGPEIPRLLSAQFRAASITEFAYLTPRGEPLCWPVTPYWYPDRGILGISTGLGYPNKAYYARRHPRVAALFGSTLLQGDALVLDDEGVWPWRRHPGESRDCRRFSRWAGWFELRTDGR